MKWATFQLGYVKDGGTCVYCPLEIAIQIAKRDGLPFVKDLSHGSIIVWEREK